jgi:putative DNA primase/helicase
MPVTVQNIEIFARAGAEAFGSQRDGDQYGALLAGAWSLVSTRVATLDEARAMIKRYDWGEYRENSDADESSKVLDAIMGKLVRTQRGADVTVFELVAAAAGRPVDGSGIEPRDAISVIGRLGLSVRWLVTRYDKKKGGEVEAWEEGLNREPATAHLFVANRSPGLDELMSNTSYASDLRRQIERIPGSRKQDPVRFSGRNARSISIPLTAVFGGADEPAHTADEVDDDLPF